MKKKKDSVVIKATQKTELQNQYSQVNKAPNINDHNRVLIIQYKSQ